jgi:CMP-N,N'-diacetyllegionaminic acid synthase
MNNSEDMRVLGLILARGGSKRLPGKNVRLLQGKPLLAWSIEAALACPFIDSIVVSTDSSSIADVALAYGAEVPFLRPEALAQDDSSSADSALHALDQLRSLGRQDFDVVILLEPTSPLRASGDLGGVVDLLTKRWDQTDAVITVGRVRLENPNIMKTLGNGGFITPWLPTGIDFSSSACPVPWFPYGVAYAIKVSALQQWRSFYPPRVLGYTIERWQNYEVDDELDFVCIESIVKYFGGKLP